MATVIVLAGGTSEEREISLRSGKAVTAALIDAGHKVTQLDTKDGLETLLPQLQTSDVIFPILHGAGGEDGSLQQFLEAHRLRFVGSDSAASQLCFDKWRYTQLLLQHNLPVPETELVNISAFHSSPLITKPFVIKPNDGGSSIDTFIVRDVNNYDKVAVDDAFTRHRQMLLQNLIEGIETTVGIVGDSALPVIEIIPPPNAEFDYENKYNGATQELCPPKNVPEDIQDKVKRLAEEIHTLTGCRDFSRTDIFYTPTDGKLYVLETNTLPGMTDQSLVPRAAAVSGLAMPALVDKLISFALAR